MCGSATTTVSTPAKSNLPDRHAVRHAIRKVAREMRKAHASSSSWDVKVRVMTALNSSSMSGTEYDKTWTRVGQSITNSTFFSQSQGHCGETNLTVRKAAIL